MRFKGFIGPSYTLRSVNVDCQRCVNLYPEQDELGTGKAGEVMALNSTPGLALLETLPTSPLRGAYTAGNGTLYVVAGNVLYSISSTWNATALGTLLTSAGPVSMADNGILLNVVDGQYGYYFTFATSSFIQITDPGFLGATQVAYFDTQFVYNQPGTGQLYLGPSSAAATTPFDATQVAQAESKSDTLMAISNSHENLWLFCSGHTEVWYDAGNAYPTFPYQPIQGAIIEIGCAAAFSVARQNDTVFWLGADDKGQGIVWMANGYTPQRISTHAVEYAMQGYASISDATGYCYQENGHNFYVLNFTAGNATWVFDMTTSLWHERAHTATGVFNRHLGQCHAFAYGVHVLGDWQSGNLYQMSSNIYADNGGPITRMRIAPHIVEDLDRVFYSSFQLDIETGVGLDGIAQGTNPQAILTFSDDGGYSWSNEKWASFGAIGQRKTRVIWRRLGYSRDRVFKVVITDPVIVTLIGAELNLGVGSS